MACKRRIAFGLLLIVPLVANGRLLAADSYAQQRARLEAMSAEEKEQLQRKKERFDALSEAEQNRLRELHNAIATAPQSEELIAVMTRYNEWLKTLSSAMRAELLSLPPDERIKRIKEIKQEQERQRFREFANNLPEQDMNVVYSWMEEFVGEHEAEFLKRMPPDFRRRMEQMEAAERRKALISGMLWRRGDEDSPQPGEAELQKLLPRLSEETRKELDRATSQEEQLSAVRTLVRAAVVSKVFPPITDEQRQQVFARLNSLERERLEQMAPDMMRRELTRLYHAQQFRERDGWRGGGGRPGPGGPRFGPGRREDGPPPGEDRAPGRPDGPREERREGARERGPEGGREFDRREFGASRRAKAGPPAGAPRPADEPESAAPNEASPDKDSAANASAENGAADNKPAETTDSP